MKTTYKDILESFTSKVINKAKSASIEDKRENVLHIQFEDSEVERICHEHGVYTYDDAREVTSIKGWFSDGDWLHQQSTIEKFDELKYFTGLTNIGEDSFSYCKSLKSINIPDSVTSIGNYAFRSCKSLQSINIPNSITSIGERAFQSCESLQSITIPDGVTSIGYYTFSWCKSLQSIVISKNCPVYDKIANDYPNIQLVEPKVNESFTSKVIKNTKEKTIDDKRESVVNIIFDDPEVERICHNHGVYTINDAANVETIMKDYKTSWFTGNNEIKSFEEFKYFTGIKNPIIEQNTFYGCDKLEKIELPNHIEQIMSCAFSECTNLYSIKLPEKLSTIEVYAFFACKNLKEIELPSSLNNIHHHAFSNTGLVSIDIPDSVESISFSAFLTCQNLKSVKLPKNKSFNVLNNDIFRHCNSLISIDIPNNVTTIRNRAFCECQNLRTITISTNIINILSDAFADTDLRYIFVRDLDNSFDGENGFKERLLKGMNEYETLKNRKIDIVKMIDNVNESFTSNVIKKTKETTQENKREHIVAINFKDPEVERICHDHGVYTINDAANVKHLYDDLGRNGWHSWFAYTNIKEFDELKYFTGLEGIDHSAFSYCRQLTHVTLPPNIKYINNHTFRSCKHLRSIIIPNGVTTIGDSCFEDDILLRSIFIPSTVKNYGGNVFSNTSLRYVYVDTDDFIKNLPLQILRKESIVYILVKDIEELKKSIDDFIFDPTKYKNLIPIEKHFDINESFTSNVIKNVKDKSQKQKREEIINFYNLTLGCIQAQVEKVKDLKNKGEQYWEKMPPSINSYGESEESENKIFGFTILSDKKNRFFASLYISFSEKQCCASIQEVEDDGVSEYDLLEGCNIIDSWNDTYALDKISHELIITIVKNYLRTRISVFSAGVYEPKNLIKMYREEIGLSESFTRNIDVKNIEDYKKKQLEEIKNSLESIIKLVILQNFTMLKEYKTESTGSVYRHEYIIDYDSFFVYFSQLLKEKSLVWQPEGSLILRIDEGINQISVRDSETRHSFVNMSNCNDSFFNMVKSHSRSSAPFIAKMCYVILKKRLDDKTKDIIKEELLKKVNFDSLFESFTSNVIKKAKDTSIENKREIVTEFVDLGLPSKTLWCSHNYGTEKEEGRGSYYTFPDSQKIEFNNNNERIASPENYHELEFYCNYKWTTINGQPGREFTSKINGKSIFLPAAGCLQYDMNDPRKKIVFQDNTEGYYWTNEEYEYNEKYAYDIIFDENGISFDNFYAFKLCEFPIRTIISKEKIEESFTSNVIEKTKETTTEKNRKELFDYVDLGLPSGTLWKKYNVGANEEAEHGKLFSYEEMNNIDTKSGSLPTINDFRELRSNCEEHWMESYEDTGIRGYLFISKINNNYIFLPADGYGEEDSQYFLDSNGYYWTTDLTNAFDKLNGPIYNIVSFDNNSLLYMHLKDVKKAKNLSVRLVKK